MTLSLSGVYKKESYMLNLGDEWSPVGKMREARAGHMCSRVDDQIVVVGGKDASSNLDSVEIFNITSREWRMAGKREHVNITVLKIFLNSEGIE